MDFDAIHAETDLDLYEAGILTHGHNASLIRLKDKDGQSYIAKSATNGSAKLDIEGWMLLQLAQAGLPVPHVYYYDSSTLIMDDLGREGPKTKSFEEQAAYVLAKLHNHRAQHYGLERDTLIGPLDQPNSKEDSWLVFFRDHRLMHYGRIALKKGRIDKALMGRIDRLADKLDHFITDPAPPSLIHGDAWAGNMLAGAHGLAGFIDPAIYYADPEIELSFIDLMGGVSARFFDTYYDVHPKRDGFEEIRLDLYNLYPLLVHAILFGGGYSERVDSIVTRLV